MLPMTNPSPVRRTISIDATAEFLPFPSGAGGPAASGGSGSGTTIGDDAPNEMQDETDEIRELSEALKPLPEAELRQEKPKPRPVPITPPVKSKLTDRWRQFQRSLLSEDHKGSPGTGGGYSGYGSSSADTGGFGGFGAGGYGGGGTGRSSAIANHIAMIASKIQQNVNRDLCRTAQPEIEFAISLKPDGNLERPPRILRGSGIASCDDAIERAILQSLPLPVPDDAETFAALRELNLLFKPNDENLGIAQ